MKPVEITVYRISGKQFFFSLPNAVCEECELTVRQVKSVLRELGLEGDPRIKLTVKPWVEYMDEALAKGGWHPPVLMVNRQIFSQGVVPERAKLKLYLQRVMVARDKAEETAKSTTV